MEGHSEEDGFVSLMARASEGNAAAQADICSRYERQVRIVARVLLGNALRPHLDSVDLMQSVHKSLLIGIRNQRFDISSPEKLVALACTIVRRKVARKWRTHRRQVRLTSTDSNVDSLEATLQSIAVESATPVDIAARNDAIETLCKDLNDIERIMVERRLDGYTTGEVASELGLHPVAIRVRWTRLRQRLQAAGVLSEWL